MAIHLTSVFGHHPQVRTGATTRSYAYMPAAHDLVVRRPSDEQAVADFLAAAPNEPCALVIEGEPGIGKTALWLDTVRRAREVGFTVLAVRAAMAESVLAYTVLADLLGAVDNTVWTDLPASQLHALDAVLLRQDQLAADADQRAVTAAFETVIDRLAARGPVVLAIDDLQWLDASSAAVLFHAARRFPAGAALLCTTRADGAARLQLPRPDAVRPIRLAPMTIGALREMLRVRLGTALNRPTLVRIHELSGGNPFYAVALASEMANQAPGAPVVLPDSFAELVRTRLGRVDEHARDALLAVASLADPTVPLIAQATDTTPQHLLEMLDDAETQGVVAVSGNRLRFTHPVLAHGVYSAASPARRRAMHRRLAELLTDPELHARHLALSDPAGAPPTLKALDTAAKMARRRGAPVAAAEFVEMAIRLGGDTPKRRIRSARNHLDAGDSARARGLLDETIAALEPGCLRAEALNTLAVVSLYDDSFGEAGGLLQQALEEVGEHLPLRVQTLVTLSFTLLNLGDIEAALSAVEQAVTQAELLGYPPLLSQALSLQAHVSFRHGDGMDENGLQRALDLEDREAYVPAALRPSVQRALLLGWSGELDEAHDQMTRLWWRCVERGEENELVHTAFNVFQIEIWRGNFAAARQLADDAMEPALQLGGDLALGTVLTMRATLAAYAGDELQARADARAALETANRCGARVLAQWPIASLGFLEVSLGNYAAALNTLAPLLADPDAAARATEICVASHLPDAVEALVALGRFDEAQPLSDALERNGARLDRPWMLAVGARCRAMLLASRGDLAAASAAVDDAMTHHDHLPMPFERARSQLLLGQLERRRRRRDAAVTALHDAQQTFERLGSTLWADRARNELARIASGHRRTEGLTPAEQRVAEHAAAGMSNKDIAAALFISPKTVEVNLSRIYRKLEIHSRADLYQVMSVPSGC